MLNTIKHTKFLNHLDLLNKQFKHTQMASRHFVKYELTFTHYIPEGKIYKVRFFLENTEYTIVKSDNTNKVYVISSNTGNNICCIFENDDIYMVYKEMYNIILEEFIAQLTGTESDYIFWNAKKIELYYKNPEKYKI